MIAGCQLLPIKSNLTTRSRYKLTSFVSLYLGLHLALDHLLEAQIQKKCKLGTLYCMPKSKQASQSV